MEPKEITEEYVARKVQSRISEWTDERGLRFIVELIKSGDIFLTCAPNTVITENDFDKKTTRTVSFDAANLWCYEPYRGNEELKSEILDLKRQLKIAECGTHQFDNDGICKYCTLENFGDD